MRSRKAVFVVWIDSATNGGWVYPGTLQDGGVSRIESVGWLVGDHKDYIEITTSVSDANRGLDIISIPKVAILKRRSVNIDKKKEAD